MQSVSAIGRIAALGAVIGAIVLVAVVLFAGGGGGYEVRTEFVNASQLVKGNLVQVAGTQVGSVKDIELTPDGQALVTLSMNEDYAPLREGTTATIRQFSLSGIANRYVDLTLPSGPDEQNPEIEDGGLIDGEETDEPVDLDQIFNVFDPVARVAVQDFFEGSAAQFRGRGEEANRGWQYLNPSLSTTSRLFRELNRDSDVLEAFLVDSARLVTTAASRRDDLAALVGNLNETTRALGNEKLALAEAIARLPDFMRSANTTFVNLRSTLDTLDPLVAASEPVVSRPGAGNDLQELLPELRAFTNDAEPAVADLDRTLVHPGKSNDLLDLQETFPSLASTALDTRSRTVNPAAVPFAGNKRSVKGRPRDVGRVPGAFPQITTALQSSAPMIAQGRPYTPDLFGWFDDFSHPGGYDALGGISRAEVIFNETSLFNTPAELPILRALGGAAFGQTKKCPGSAEPPAADGSNVFSLEEQAALDCKEDDRSTGDYAGNPYNRVGPGGGPFPSR
jgi:phospholipid/cholesterol/gamma-HCH transport system substrate-binding protein